MLLHHDDYRCFIATLTTSRRINAAPHHLARGFSHPGLFAPPAADRQRPHPVAIELDPVPDGRGTLTLNCPGNGISERRPLLMRHLSAWRFTAETDEDEAVRDIHGAYTFALTIDLSPLLRPGLALATRVILSFRFVREAW